MSDKPQWEYERGDHRYKHRWSNDHPGFELGERGWVGKCASSIDEETAQRLLNAGIPLYETARERWPDRIYAVHGGAVYEAVPTTPGKSYHGYPWRGDLPGRPHLPRAILRELERKAETDGCKRELKQWPKRYGG